MGGWVSRQFFYIDVCMGEGQTGGWVGGKMRCTYRWVGGWVGGRGRTQKPFLVAGRVTSMRMVMVKRPVATEAARGFSHPKACPHLYLWGGGGWVGSWEGSLVLWLSNEVLDVVGG